MSNKGGNIHVNTPRSQNDAKSLETCPTSRYIPMADFCINDKLTDQDFQNIFGEPLEPLVRNQNPVLLTDHSSNIEMWELDEDVHYELPMTEAMQQSSHEGTLWQATSPRGTCLR